ncbi:MAG: HD domain-containing protein [Phycisphaerales bacterium]|nr:MAG: HD domain-containing protein [Phycisphaerales bacterium]
MNLLQRKYPDITVRVTDPALDELIDFEDDSHDRTVAQTAARKISRSMEKVDKRICRHTALTAVDIKALHGPVRETMKYLEENPVSIALMPDSLDRDHYLREHSGNVFFLSMLLGAAVREHIVAERQRQTAVPELSRRFSLNITPLGLGAMLCDIGMLPLEHLFTTDEPLTEDDQKAIHDHPHVGADMLPEGFSALAKMIVRTHHENFNGSGYPKRMNGDSLHIFTRIVRIADAYDAATAKHVYKEAKSAARVLWEMTCGPYYRFFDPVLMKVFAGLIQPFPIGAKLRLADGRYAVVVRYNRKNPFLPNVIIAFDAKGERLPKEDLRLVLSLEDRNDLYVRSFAGEDLSYLYGADTSYRFVPARKEINTLFEAAYP